MVVDTCWEQSPSPKEEELIRRPVFNVIIVILISSHLRPCQRRDDKVMYSCTEQLEGWSPLLCV